MRPYPETKNKKHHPRRQLPLKMGLNQSQNSSWMKVALKKKKEAHNSNIHMTATGKMQKIFIHRRILLWFDDSDASGIALMTKKPPERNSHNHQSSSHCLPAWCFSSQPHTIFRWLDSSKNFTMEHSMMKHIFLILFAVEENLSFITVVCLSSVISMLPINTILTSLLWFFS